MKITVSQNKRTLLRDGQHFFYLADTCWSAFTSIQENDWITYLDKRKEQGFNTLQINVLPQWDRSRGQFDFRFLLMRASLILLFGRMPISNGLSVL